MTYRELLALYREDRLTDAEREGVAREIEKHEALDEYLMERDWPEAPAGELPECARGEEADLQAAVTLEKQVNAYIRKSFIKAGVIVGALVLVIVLVTLFFLPKLVDRFYYDPNETVGVTVSGKTNRMSLDLSVYTELFVPCGRREAVVAEPEGYGNYRLSLPQMSSYSGIFTDTAGYLSKGKLTLYDPNVVKHPTGNAFVPALCSVDARYYGHGAAGSPEDALEALQELRDREPRIAYITLDHVMDYDEFMRWSRENDIGAVWCTPCVRSDGTYTDFEYETPEINMGFSLSDACYQLGFDEEKYPLLSLFSLTETSSPERDFEATADNVKRHMVSLLRYTSDNPEFSEMMGMGPGLDTVLRDFADKIEEQGILIYGFAMVGEKDELIRVGNDPQTAYIYTSPLS